MSKSEQNPQHNEGREAPEQEAQEAGRETAAAADNEAEAARAELEQVREQMLRIAAAEDNTRKRAAREIANARKYAVSSFARDLLDVADNLARALAAVPVDARDHASKALGGLISGVELTDKNLHKALDKHGVRKISPLGEKFNPNLHQAVAQIPSSAPAGEIVEVIQPGYLLGDRILRAAMVAVSSGQPPVPKPDAGQNEAQASPGSTVDTTA